jgi:hypothetical protein
MANPRILVATILAAAALALALLGLIDANSATGMQMGHAGLAASHFAGLSASHIPGLAALGLSVAAFVVSWEQRSYLVAGLLIVAGIIYTVHLAPFLGDHRIIAVVGPVIGLFFGHVILALGIVKAIGSAKTPVTKTLS